MNTISIPQIGGTRFCGYAIIANAELLKENLADWDIPQVSWDDRAVVALTGELASPDSAVIGLITWQKVEWRKECTIKLGWVDPLFRRQGIYQLMWQRLCKDATEAGLTVITSAVKTTNLPMRQLLRKLGREEEAVQTVYRLGINRT